MDKVDVLAVMEEEMDRRLTNYNAAMRGEAPEALADRLHEELRDMATARAAVAELIEAGSALAAAQVKFDLHGGDPDECSAAWERHAAALARVKAD